mgnify:FL=1|tara:strand:- start:5827 stop:7068 length:1242 start_codon:yes stop_codon:yes gene_type:complete
MFLFYQFLTSVLIIVSPLLLIIRIIKKKEDKKRFWEKFCLQVKSRPKGNLIWFHCASIGETMSILPILDYYEKNRKIKNILLTTTTVSSSKIIKKYKFKKLIHQFYPIDHSIITNKFLNHWKPNVAIFLESEIWPNMFKELKKNKINLILLNARITKKTFNRWIKLSGISKKIFSYIKIAYPQNKETKKYLTQLKVKKIKLIRNLKFIENKIKNQKQIYKKFSNFIINRKIWVAASTHSGEEVIAAKTHILLKKKFDNLITIIIPRHINRVDQINEEIKKLNLHTILHSSNDKLIKKIDIYIVDTFGESKLFYGISPTVFLGKSITAEGGQNPLEAARFGAKILNGPNVENFDDIYKLLKSLKISKEVKNAEQIAQNITFKKDIKKSKKIRSFGNIILKKTIQELNREIYNEI